MTPPIIVLKIKIAGYLFVFARQDISPQRFVMPLNSVYKSNKHMVKYDKFKGSS